MSILSPVASAVSYNWLNCLTNLTLTTYQQLRASFVSVNLFSLLCDGSSPVTVSSLGDISRYGGPILYLFLYAFVLFGILVWVDSGSIIVRKFSQFRKKPMFSSGTGAITTLDEKTNMQDVDDEAAKVTASDDALRVMSVVKAFDSATNRVVDNVSFGVSQDTIFALLGPNGAGKTTTFNVIRACLSHMYLDVYSLRMYAGGDVIPDEGDVLINGVSMVHHPRSARLSLGVCPQFTAIDSQLTVREHLLIYGRLKGLYRGEEVKGNVESLMRATSLHMYADRLASKLSGGNQRKLSLAIALIGALSFFGCGVWKRVVDGGCIGNPSVILIDEFSTGIDAKMKRDMWGTLRNVAVGKAIVITTRQCRRFPSLYRLLTS